MTRLYWRIFLAFWLVLVAAVLVTAGVNAVIFRDEVASTRAEALRASLDALAEQAERRLRVAGVDGLRDWLRQRDLVDSTPPLLVIGPRGRDILGRPTPPGARMLRGLTDDGADVGPSIGPKTGDSRRRIRERLLRGTRRIEDAAGNRYVLVVPPFERRGGPWIAAPRARSTFPVVLVLISGFVCLLLARYLTRPIAAFRGAGQRIAAGHLDARVGPDVARRRDEFGLLARDFDDMAGRVEQLVDSQQRLLRDVSHELRSPLARLQAAVGLLRQRGGDDANIDRIERELEVLNELIGRTLGFSRLQGQTTLDSERFDVAELVGSVIDDAQFENAGAGLRFEFAAAGPQFVVADEALLRSAVDNVVRNAAKHARGTIDVAIGRVGDDGALRIVVGDDGPGVAAADLPRLFEPFFTTGTAPAGAGVGLAIARRAIELHGGKIEARNGDAGGLVVTIELPAQETG